MQGDLRVMDITAGENFLGLCDNKSSYVIGYGIMGVF
jgi:hypothetical protein